MASQLEAYILPFVKALTRPEDFVKNLTDGLTACRVGEIATALNEPDIAGTTRDVVLAGLWLDQCPIAHKIPS